MPTPQFTIAVEASPDKSEPVITINFTGFHCFCVAVTFAEKLALHLSRLLELFDETPPEDCSVPLADTPTLTPTPFPDTITKH